MRAERNGGDGKREKDKEGREKKHNNERVVVVWVCAVVDESG
jgi:hypothetical protein